MLLNSEKLIGVEDTVQLTLKLIMVYNKLINKALILTILDEI